MLIRVVLLLLLTLTAGAQTREQRVEALLARMTLEEKLGQLSQYVPDQPEFIPALEKGLVGALLNTGGVAQVNDLQRRALAASRLKIPILIGHDVVHGYRTIFPIPLGIAATWDPSLAELSARIAAKEARAAGIRWTFAPMVDIARDPRWGRIAEGAGEDPHLGARIAAAYVRGFQPTLLATAKHFAGYGAPEGGRDYGPAEMSEATLREVYLPPFQAAVDAGVATLMAGFNTVNGVPATANRHLLRTILRDEWKFRGFVVSDFAGVTELIHHGVAASPQDAAALAISAGVDMAMWDSSYMKLGNRVPLATIDDAVRRVLRAKIDAGLFDDPFTDPDQSVALTREHRDAARRVAQRSFVLLKNEGGVLPLEKDVRIFVAGALAESKIDLLGSWAAEGKAEETPSIVEALRARGAQLAPRAEADVLVAVLGETRDQSGEAASRSSLDLPGTQQQLLEELVATGKPVVLIVLAGRPLSIAWAAEHVPSIVQAWFPGTEGAAALGDVLFGDVNPSGKLPVTIPRNVGQVPIHHAMLPSGRPAHPENKFTNKYADVAIEPLYPFGHGLSYTTFEYSELTVSPTAASVTVRNSGKRAGEEVVQLYLTDVVAGVSRPVRQLKAFQRIALAPGESKRVGFAITREHLRFWSNGRWLVEPGMFRVRIGPSSASGPEGTFILRE
jgi:beta-glucosidase